MTVTACFMPARRLTAKRRRSDDGPTSLVTEVTPTLCCLWLRFTRAIPVIRNNAASARPRRPIGGTGTSDSEGYDERSFGQQLCLGLVARAQDPWQRGQMEPRNDVSVVGVGDGTRAIVLADKRDCPYCDGSAMVVSAHARGAPAPIWTTTAITHQAPR